MKNKQIFVRLVIFAAVAPMLGRCDVREDFASAVSINASRLSCITNYQVSVKSVISSSPIITGDGKWGDILSTTTYYYCDGMFRINYVVESSYLKGISVSNWMAAFDGRRYAWYRGDVSQLTYSTNANPVEPFAMPNPVVANFLFLSPESDVCKSCYVSLPQLITAPPHPSKLLARIVQGNSNLVAYQGGVVEGKPSLWKLDWSPTYSNAFVPKRIIRSFNGLDLLTFEFTGYTNLASLGADAVVPAGYKLFGFDDAHDLIFTGLVEVVNISRNQQFSPDFYGLGDVKARSIFDSDRQHFVKSAPFVADLQLVRKRSVVRECAVGMLVLTSLIIPIWLMWKKFGKKCLDTYLLLCLMLVALSVGFGCSRKGEAPIEAAEDGGRKFTIVNDSATFNEDGFGAIRFGMNAQQLEQVAGSPDSKTGNVASYNKKNISIITTRKDGKVFEISYGSMGLVGATSVDTNIFNVAFGVITLGSSKESVMSSWGKPQKDFASDGLYRQVYDRPKSLVTLTYSNNKLILISVRSKEALSKF